MVRCEACVCMRVCVCRRALIVVTTLAGIISVVALVDSPQDGPYFPVSYESGFCYTIR